MNEISILRSFAAGAVSFISPCVLFLIPFYFSLSSCSFFITERKSIRDTVLPFTYVIGFLVTFMIIGTASSSPLSRFFISFQDHFRLAGSILTIGYGVLASGLFKAGFFRRETVLHLAWLFLMGIGFGAGWTPCIGPTLGNILLAASSQGTAFRGITLLALYSIGLAVPFMLMTSIVQAFLLSAAKSGFFKKIVLIPCSLVLVLFGIILITDNLRRLTVLFPDLVNY